MNYVVPLKGLYLWEVALRNGDGENLNIVTTRNSERDAKDKAQRFLKRHRRHYPKASIASIKSQGTIDA